MFCYKSSRSKEEILIKRKRKIFDKNQNLKGGGNDREREATHCEKINKEKCHCLIYLQACSNLIKQKIIDKIKPL